MLTNKHGSMKTSELLNLLTDAPDDEIDNILSEIQIRPPFSYHDERVEALEAKIETLESNFKKHIHSEGKIYIELK